MNTEEAGKVFDLLKIMMKQRIDTEFLRNVEESWPAKGPEYAHFKSGFKVGVYSALSLVPHIGTELAQYWEEVWKTKDGELPDE